MIIENNPSIRNIKHLTFRAVIISHEMFHGVGSDHLLEKFAKNFFIYFKNKGSFVVGLLFVTGKILVKDF